jgi:polyvinyl alcohol dehydrogenase (cytochrome)
MFAAVLVSLFPGPAHAQTPPDWRMGGRDLANTRHQPNETAIGPDNVSRLAPRWVFTTGGDVSATPAVADGFVYVPDWAGNLFKIDAATGVAARTRRVGDYIGRPDAFSRVTPAQADGVLYLGTHEGAYLLAVSAATGELVWRTQLDAHPAARITQSAVVHGSRVYVGTSSDEEIFASRVRGYPCCTFRGAMYAVDTATGDVVWRAYTVPDHGGAPGTYSGVAVWGSTPVVDAERGALYFTTGNNYSAPAGGGPLPADNHVDAIVAVDLQTGAVRWSRRVQGPDAWNTACLTLRQRRNCPDPEGPDYDFAQGPMLFTVATPQGPRQILGAGQKSGIFWALDPATGAVVWTTVVGPAGGRGGLQWESATDGQRIYVSAANSGRKPFTLVSGRTIRGSAWSALDAATGAILWQTAVPLANIAMAPVTVANGVVYAGAITRQGHNMFALDAATGAIKWRFASGGSVNGGAAVVDGTVYWGSGYSKLGQGRPNDKLYAFELPR